MPWGHPAERKYDRNEIVNGYEFNTIPLRLSPIQTVL